MRRSRIRLRQIIPPFGCVVIILIFVPSSVCFFIQKSSSTALSVKSSAKSPTSQSPSISMFENSFGRKPIPGERSDPSFPRSLVETAFFKEGDPWKTSLGVLIGGAVIAGLAATTEPATDPVEGAYGAVFNVLDAAVPGSSTDLVAVALGEAIAGVIGAFLTALLRSISSKNRKPLVTEALSDSDYFIAQAGLMPVLQAIGVSPILASIGSVVVASVPSQLVKIGSQEKQRRKEEEKSLLELLEAEKKKQEEQSRTQMQQRVAALRRIRPSVKEVGVDPKGLKPISESELDFVEIFSDLTRWLGYNVLKSDFGDILLYTGSAFSPGIMGATFGFLAAFTARLYADLLYGVLRYGPEVKQAEVRTRQIPDWFAYYASSSLSAAALFGVYEQSQRPISRWIQGILAGGFDGCLGSDFFDVCFDTYIQTNAPGPSAEAQVRALTTNFIMVGQRLQDIAGDTTAEDIARLIRAWAVSANSYLNHVF